VIKDGFKVSFLFFNYSLRSWSGLLVVRLKVRKRLGIPRALFHNLSEPIFCFYLLASFKCLDLSFKGIYTRTKLVNLQWSKFLLDAFLRYTDVVKAFWKLFYFIFVSNRHTAAMRGGSLWFCRLNRSIIKIGLRLSTINRLANWLVQMIEDIRDFFVESLGV